jgi:dTDP-glucose 4,6-dehydratase
VLRHSEHDVTAGSGPVRHVLLTGGTGFFGRALLRHWAAQREGERPLVTILTRSPSRFLQAVPEFASCRWLQLHTGDILRPESLPAGGRFSHLLHAAADSTIGAQLAPLQRFDQIVRGTRHLLDHAVAHRIPRVLFVSSGGVYGTQPADMMHIPESYHGMPDPMDPHQAYGVAKRCAEQLCCLFQNAHGVDTVVARGFAFVGRDLPLHVHFAIGNFIRDALTGSAILVHGDGSPVRSYMDQRDLAHWLTTLLTSGRAGHAYNVGSDDGISLRDLAYLVRDTLAPEKPVHVAGSSGPQGPRHRYVPSIRKAQEELGLTLRFTLIEAIREAATHPRLEWNLGS